MEPVLGVYRDILEYRDVFGEYRESLEHRDIWLSPQMCDMKLNDSERVTALRLKNKTNTLRDMSDL